MVQTTDRAAEIKRIGMALHDVCQPMTTLQCRLELATMVDTPEAYREAVDSGLELCERLSASIVSMRELVRKFAGDQLGPGGTV